VTGPKAESIRVVTVWPAHIAETRQELAECLKVARRSRRDSMARRGARFTVRLYTQQYLEAAGGFCLPCFRDESEAWRVLNLMHKT
jgi:hypothetical protein